MPPVEIALTCFADLYGTSSTYADPRVAAEGLFKEMPADYAKIFMKPGIVWSDEAVALGATLQSITNWTNANTSSGHRFAAEDELSYCYEEGLRMYSRLSGKEKS